ncbi:MAG: winged helix-turn-helix domain-containing protein [Deltaproteobacteria bacterium]|nr:winged helix-turn-helix domain-containing protein [Deltaproteobacteria bacterium]
MTHEIGETAGKVWKYLERNGETNLSQLKKGVPADTYLIHQALGWLARDDKLRMERNGRTVIYALK